MSYDNSLQNEHEGFLSEVELDQPSLEDSEIAQQLEIAAAQYRRRVPEIKENYYKKMVIKRIENSINAIEIMIDFFNKKKRFTPEKRLFCRQLVKNAAIMALLREERLEENRQKEKFNAQNNSNKDNT